jgi:hypothetical protein
VIRRVLLACAIVLSIAAALRFYEGARYVVHGSREIRTLLGTARGPALVFVVQPEDCLGNGLRLASWTALHESGTVPVSAAVVGKGLSRRQRDLFARHGVEIPLTSISLQDAAIVAEKLGYASTPFAVIFDRRGRVAAAFPAERNMPAEIVQRIASQ